MEFLLAIVGIIAALTFWMSVFCFVLWFMETVFGKKSK